MCCTCHQVFACIPHDLACVQLVTCKLLAPATTVVSALTSRHKWGGILLGIWELGICCSNGQLGSCLMWICTMQEVSAAADHSYSIARTHSSNPSPAHAYLIDEDAQADPLSGKLLRSRRLVGKDG